MVLPLPFPCVQSARLVGSRGSARDPLGCCPPSGTVAPQHQASDKNLKKDTTCRCPVEQGRSFTTSSVSERSSFFLSACTHTLSKKQLMVKIPTSRHILTPQRFWCDVSSASRWRFISSSTTFSPEIPKAEGLDETSSTAAGSSRLDSLVIPCQTQQKPNLPMAGCCGVTGGMLEGGGGGAVR